MCYTWVLIENTSLVLRHTRAFTCICVNVTSYLRSLKIHKRQLLSVPLGLWLGLELGNKPWRIWVMIRITPRWQNRILEILKTSHFCPLLMQQPLAICTTMSVQFPWGKRKLTGWDELVWPPRRGSTRTVSGSSMSGSSAAPLLCMACKIIAIPMAINCIHTCHVLQAYEMRYPPPVSGARNMNLVVISHMAILLLNSNALQRLKLQSCNALML